MKRTICALLAALVGVFAFTGATILNGRVDTHAVDVAHAVPVTASGGTLFRAGERGGHRGAG